MPPEEGRDNLVAIWVCARAGISFTSKYLGKGPGSAWKGLPSAQEGRGCPQEPGHPECPGEGYKRTPFPALPTAPGIPKQHKAPARRHFASPLSLHGVEAMVLSAPAGPDREMSRDRTWVAGPEMPRAGNDRTRECRRPKGNGTGRGLWEWRRPPPRPSVPGAAPTCRPPRPSPAGGGSADRPSMEGTRRALLRLAAACCLLCALPGEGQKTTETVVLSPLLNTVPTSHQLREVSDLSPDTTAVPETSLEKNVTAAALNATGVHPTDEDAFISATPVVGTETERLQASTTASPTAITVIQHEHHNMSLSANSTEIPSPASTASTLEKNLPDHEVTEPFSATEEMDDASSATPTPPNSVSATTNRSQLEPTSGQTMGPTVARAETRPGTSPVVSTEAEASAPTSTVGSTSPATTSSTVTMRLPMTSSTAASTAAIPTSTSPVGQQLEPMHEKASVLDVGDDENPELPSSPTMRADPSVIAVISVFIVMVGILGLVGFLRYRQHNSHMEFRRLQDLPMDDMMEDTPLSLYSY